MTDPVATEPIRFVIVTGLSGAGKSYAIKCLEDLGYFCVDNLPTTLIPTFAELCANSSRGIHAIALGVDVREGARVTAGEPLCTVWYNDGSRWQAARRCLGPAFRIGGKPPGSASLVLERIE